MGPRPVQQPAPPIWFGAWTAPAIERAARLGDAWLGGPSAALAELSACVASYRQTRGALGKEPGEIAAFRYVFVAGTTAQALESAGESFIRAYENMYFRWPHPIIKRPPGELTIERLAENRIILGDPETCFREISRFRQELGLDHLICRFSVPGISREASTASLDLFAREVMPALR